MSPEGRARNSGGTESPLGEAKEEPSGVRVAVVPSDSPTGSPGSVGRLAGSALRLMMQAVAVVSVSPTDSFRTEKTEHTDPFSLHSVDGVAHSELDCGYHVV
jgi:hypothetical protein